MVSMHLQTKRLLSNEIENVLLLFQTRNEIPYNSQHKNNQQKFILTPKKLFIKITWQRISCCKLLFLISIPSKRYEWPASVDLRSITSKWLFDIASRCIKILFKNPYMIFKSTKICSNFFSKIYSILNIKSKILFTSHSISRLSCYVAAENGIKLFQGVES